MINFKQTSDQDTDLFSLILRFWKTLRLDGPLVAGLLSLVTFGLFILYSASDSNLSILFHQVVILIIGLVLMACCAQVSPGRYQKLAPVLFAAFLSLLIIVLGIGAISKGGQRWLSLGFFRFQPSEIMKLLVPLVLAWYLRDKILPPKGKDLFLSLVIIFLPALIVAKQPDMGTGIMIALSGIAILIFAGINWRVFFVSALSLAVSLPLIWHFMYAYQKARILTLFDPERDPLNKGYHIIQSKIAIGSGGFFGKGWLHGTQSHLQFLPEHKTDFIFAVFGEEFGLIGVFVLCALFLYIVGRGLYLSSHAQDTFSRLLIAGLSLMFFFSFFVNVGMVCGILPVVGLPLPLISYGGSSILTLLAGFGIIMSLRAHQRLLPS